MAKIILGISSSIAVYKALDLVSKLKKKGMDVYSILTTNAQKLISPLLFHNLSGHFVCQDYFTPENRETMEHIRLAKECDLMVVYPASANTLATLAGGLANDLLSTTALAIDCPLLVFAAMNPTMWRHPATQANVATLRKRGVEVIEPETGEVACGDFGPGKLSEVEPTLAKIDEHLTSLSTLAGKKLLLTLGGSKEMIDPVRYIGNRSSGKMGLALARVLKKKGAILELLVGNVSEPIEGNWGGVSRFTSTEDLLCQLKQKIAGADILIMNAAPGDFRVEKSADQKIKSTKPLLLKLVKTPDILKELPKTSKQVFVGFAAETDDIKKNALAKLQAKNIDLIIANKVLGVVDEKKVGIGEDYTDMMIIDKMGVLYESRGAEKKTQAAQTIVEFLEEKVLLL